MIAEKSCRPSRSERISKDLQLRANRREPQSVSLTYRNTETGSSLVGSRREPGTELPNVLHSFVFVLSFRCDDGAGGRINGDATMVATGGDDGGRGDATPVNDSQRI